MKEICVFEIVNKSNGKIRYLLLPEQLRFTDFPEKDLSEFEVIEDDYLLSEILSNPYTWKFLNGK